MTTNHDPRPITDRPAPVPGLGPDSWVGLTPEAIAIRQRTAAARDLAHRVDAHRSYEISEEEREATPGLVSARKQTKPTKARQIRDNADAVRNARPARRGETRVKIKSPAASTASAGRSSLPPVINRDPTTFNHQGAQVLTRDDWRLITKALERERQATRRERA